MILLTERFKLSGEGGPSKDDESRAQMIAGFYIFYSLIHPLNGKVKNIQKFNS